MNLNRNLTVGELLVKGKRRLEFERDLIETVADGCALAFIFVMGYLIYVRVWF